MIGVPANWTSALSGVRKAAAVDSFSRRVSTRASYA
jgi:hypothetical protein